MLMSTDRILVTHVGSLPRPPTLSALLIRQEAGERIDVSELARQVEIATAHVIEKQVEAGVDVGNDGEQSRVGFQTYVPRCLCGFGGESRRPPNRRRRARANLRSAARSALVVDRRSEDRTCCKIVVIWRLSALDLVARNIWTPRRNFVVSNMTMSGSRGK